MLPHPIPDSLAELIAQRFRVLGEPTRIRILDRLREGEASVQDLTESLGSSQQNVSKHLGVLAQAGIVGRRKEETSRSIASPTTPSSSSASRSAAASSASSRS